MSLVIDTKKELARRRIAAFEQSFGQDAFDLLCHAAFPLAVTPELLYCLRENFVRHCDRISVADLLLSSLCLSVGNELYEMEGVVRNLLLHRLKDDSRFGERRLHQLADYMSGYICHQIRIQKNDRAERYLGAEPHWTALAYTKPGEVVQQIEQAVRAALGRGDARERVRLASLVESYADLLQEAGFAPILTLARRLEEDEFFFSTFTFETVTVNPQGKTNEPENKQAQYITEDLGNGINLEMVYIPGGTFTMGSPEGEEGSYDDEKPQHQVTIKPFLMGKHPVTQAQWEAVMGNNPSHFKGENRPVEQVSWYDIIEFCARLSQKTGKNYRLPSEAEWEYACRAGTSTAFHFGETITTDLANYQGTDWEYEGKTYSGSYGQGPKGIYRQETTPVDTFKFANAFGLYDMHGNVCEWCADPCHDSYQGAPTDGSVWDENNNDNRYRNDIDLLVNIKNDNRTRLLRGASWGIFPDNCRAAFRFNYAPDARGSSFGFRVVCAIAWTPSP